MEGDFEIFAMHNPEVVGFFNPGEWEFPVIMQNQNGNGFTKYDLYPKQIKIRSGEGWGINTFL